MGAIFSRDSVKQPEWSLTSMSPSDTDYQNITQRMKNDIESHRGYSIKVLNIESISHPTLEAKYATRNAEIVREHGTGNERLLYHSSLGSHQVVKKGFNDNLVRPIGLFGPGIYFALGAFKGAGYADGYPVRYLNEEAFFRRHKMLLCLVLLGKEYEINMFHQFDQPPAGYHSVHAAKGNQLIYDEYIVYNEDQVLPRFLVTYDVDIRHR